MIFSIFGPKFVSLIHIDNFEKCYRLNWQFRAGKDFGIQPAFSNQKVDNLKFIPKIISKFEYLYVHPMIINYEMFNDSKKCQICTLVWLRNNTPLKKGFKNAAL